MFQCPSQLPVHKHESGLKTADEQLKALVDSKCAFSAGGQWCTLGFALLGLSAILCARQLQLNRDAVGNSRAKAKVKMDILAKIETVEVTLSRFRGPDKTNAPNWKIFISFLLSMFSPGKAVSKIQTVPLVKARLPEIKRDQKKQWDMCMEEEIAKARGKLVVVAEGYWAGPYE
jgi:hypothetical protein